MSHPSWLPPKSTNEPVGHVTARMETTHTFGTPSISVSTQQTPKKFAPVVAPKPKYNPYKQPGGDGKYLFFLGRNHSRLMQRNWLLTQAVLDLLFVDEFEGASLFQIIQIKKNVEVSLTLTLASYPPERCRVGGGHGDRSFLFLIGSRCPMSKTGTFQGLFLVWSLLACVDPRSWGLNNPFQYWFFHPSTMGILYKCGTELWEHGYNWGGRA